MIQIYQPTTFVWVSRNAVAVISRIGNHVAKLAWYVWAFFYFPSSHPMNLHPADEWVILDKVFSLPKNEKASVSLQVIYWVYRAHQFDDFKSSWIAQLLFSLASISICQTAIFLYCELWQPRAGQWFHGQNFATNILCCYQFKPRSIEHQSWGTYHFSSFKNPQ